jgi:hypothetical protein
MVQRCSRCHPFGRQHLPVPGCHERKKTMEKPYVESSKTDLVVIKGFEGEAIEVSIEQLETRILPQSSAGFLD